MNQTGVLLESLGMDWREGLQAAADMGLDGVQFYATRPTTHFSRLHGSALAEFRTRLTDLNLKVAALCGDFGGHGFARADDNPRRIDDTRRVIELALELGSRVVSTHVGVIPPEANHPRRETIAAACREIGEFAWRHGAVLAIETGPEPAVTLRAFIDSLGLPGGIGVNFDPANLVMVCREPVPAAVTVLAERIVHVHVKDGINLQPVNAEQLYGFFAGDGPPGFHPDDYIRETVVGEGDVPWPAVMEALRAASYPGFLTIERETGDHRRQDVVTAVRRLAVWRQSET